jgi:hypothetical protein
VKTGQDRASGAAADKWGRETASALAQKLGATQFSGSSNECRLDGDRVVIKCAAAANDSVGVTFKMLDRLDALWRPSNAKTAHLRSGLLLRPLSRHTCGTLVALASAGKVGLVRRDVFERAEASRSAECDCESPLDRSPVLIANCARRHPSPPP